MVRVLVVREGGEGRLAGKKVRRGGERGGGFELGRDGCGRPRV